MTFVVALGALLHIAGGELALADPAKPGDRLRDHRAIRESERVVELIELLLTSGTTVRRTTVSALCSAIRHSQSC